MKAKRIIAVVDTNVFIGAIIGSKDCGEVYEAFENDSFDLLLSPALLKEYQRVAEREKFKPIIKPDIKEKLLSLFEKDATNVFPAEEVSACRDPKDNIVLECAQAGKAGFIVTGDKDLLVLKKFKSARIVTPKKFIKRLRSSRS